jgi:hypothetical protein
MEIDTRLPTRLDTMSDAPEPLHSALAEYLPLEEPVSLLAHAPAFTSGEEKSPATLLADLGQVQARAWSGWGAVSYSA